MIHRCTLAVTFGPMLTARQRLGERGELIAERWLESRGWIILERRFRSGHRDIDLVAERRGAEGRLVAFVEVKTRSKAEFGGPLGAVNWTKQRELAKAARDWIRAAEGGACEFRFDVIGVMVGGPSPEIVHIENAFQLR
jgi:putative endonuclease